MKPKKLKRKPSDKEMLDWLTKKKESLYHWTTSKYYWDIRNISGGKRFRTPRQAIRAAMKAEEGK